MAPERTWNYFTNEEVDGLDKELVAALDRARHLAQIPFVITSGCRNVEENNKAGGEIDSAHLIGKAVDIRCSNSGDCFKIVKALMDSGLQRIVIGIKNSYGPVAYHNIHVDNDYSKPHPVLPIKKY